MTTPNSEGAVHPEEDERDPAENPYPPKATDERDITRIEIDVREDPFQISALVKKIDSKPPTLIMMPEYQRKEVWDIKRRSAFIESILLNYPLPPLYLNQQRSGQFFVVDGLQRTSSFYRFIKNEFPLTGLRRLDWLNGKKFEELDSILQSRIEDRKLNCYVLRPSVPLSVVYDIFARINQGGVQLERQEIRHGLYQGRSTQLLRTLVQTAPFEKWLGIRLNPTRMGDEEAALRCVAFSLVDPDARYAGDMDKFLESTMVELNKTTSEFCDVIEAQFQSVFQNIRTIIGEDAFRIATTKTRGRINIAIMESVYRFFATMPHEWITVNATRIKCNYVRLLQDSDFLNAVQASTGDTARVRARFRVAHIILGDTHAD